MTNLFYSLLSIIALKVFITMTVDIDKSRGKIVDQIRIHFFLFRVKCVPKAIVEIE